MKLSNTIQALVLLSPSLPVTYAWGGLGHVTVGFIASGFLSSNTKSFFQTLLGDYSPQYLAKVATWADSFRYTKGGRFSAPFHFIDSNDNPPSSCSVVYERDCTTHGCVVSAIQNYTDRLMDTNLPHTERVMAAKFIVHFVGDIHQPLHDENLGKGGNGIKAMFDGKDTNLHSIWDTAMLEKFVGGYSIEDAQRWAKTLSKAIKTGEYRAQATGWLEGVDLRDPVSTAMIWATEANQFVCSTVMPNGVDALEGQELGGDYYVSAVPVFKLQVAKAGYRLAAWMDAIATSIGSEVQEL